MTVTGPSAEKGIAMDFDDREFRNALGMFPSGVTVVTTGTEPNFVGMTAQSFSSLSLDPPLVLVCVDKSASVLSLLKETGAFTVNILPDTAMDTSNFFASSKRPAPPHQFDDHEHVLGVTGQPRLAAATMVFDCDIHSVINGGDHEIIIGEVKAFVKQSDDEPILFYGGNYRKMGPPDPSMSW